MGIVLAVVVAASFGGTAAGPEKPPTPGACQALLRLELAEAKVVSADAVPAGGFVPPSDASAWLVGDATFYETVPAFCRLVVKATPSADSDIRVEVWMPLAGWNGKFRGEGNGGFAGEIAYHPLAALVSRGYAVAGTNTGHVGTATDASWALGHPGKVTDFGYRAVHAMTQIAKAAIKAHYGRGPDRSYFVGCSNGGRQALMEAQRFPQDYDGILAGAPANFWTHLLTKALADAQATTREAASYIPARKLPAIAKAVNAACDARDGVTDGVLNDPARCRFDPATILCKDGDSEACLTAPQATALRALYEGPRDAGGHVIFPGYPPGAEEGEGGWGLWITGPAPGKSLLFAFATGYFTNMVYEKEGWDYRSASVPEALNAAEQKTAQKLDAVDPDLGAFQSRGGKLVLFHGWNDPAISAVNTVHYYESVVGRMGGSRTDGFLRLYMVPGMQHCNGGPGPASFGQGGLAAASDPEHDVSAALEKWVEAGAAPSALVATKFVDGDRATGAQTTRPLCPYPQIAAYKGQGDPNDGRSFACGAPAPAGR